MLSIWLVFVYIVSYHFEISNLKRVLAKTSQIALLSHHVDSEVKIVYTSLEVEVVVERRMYIVMFYKHSDLAEN